MITPLATSPGPVEQVIAVTILFHGVITVQDGIYSPIQDGVVPLNVPCLVSHVLVEGPSRLKPVEQEKVATVP